MKNFMKKISLALATTVAGVGIASAQNITPFESVEDLIISANGLIRVETSGPVLNPAGCPQTFYVIEADAPTRTLWLAQLMTAKAAGQNIRIGLNSNICVNNNTSPAISVIITE